MLRLSDAVASSAPFSAYDCHQSKLAYSSWMMFHVKHVGPGGSSSWAHSALAGGLLHGRLGVLRDDDADVSIVNDVVDAVDVAATGHEVNDVGAQLCE